MIFVVFALAASFAGLPGPLLAQSDGGIVIEHAWARASILRSRPGAAYLTIRNDGPATDRLLAATSPLAGSVTLHVSESSGGVMKMHAMKHLEIPHGQAVTMKPGGMHLMLMELHEPLREAGVLPIILIFERSGRLEVSVPILSPAAKGPEN